MRKKYEHMIKVREILTPEQRDSYDMRILAKSHGIEVMIKLCTFFYGEGERDSVEC